VLFCALSVLFVPPRLFMKYPTFLPLLSVQTFTPPFYHHSHDLIPRWRNAICPGCGWVHIQDLKSKSTEPCHVSLCPFTLRVLLYICMSCVILIFSLSPRRVHGCVCVLYFFSHLGSPFSPLTYRLLVCLCRIFFFVVL